jgi:uncharacterized protein
LTVLIKIKPLCQPGCGDRRDCAATLFVCYNVADRHLPTDGVTVLRDSINDALKDAMKSQDKRRVSTLRLVNAAIKNAEIEARGAGKEALGDDAILGVLQKMIKQRQESAELYDKGGRPELAAQEREEMEIISAYLPQQMSDLEAGSVIQQIVHEINAQGLKDMGRTMTALKERFAGKMDFAKASAKVKELLGSSRS